ncbi:hypothetical protein BJ684DRAFT_14531 [Piptocephalis cylindrospora]|uniref:Mus7/MMS22 family-domain-containing protein n=1 Tax=Piptocephalis cylindrospora TaxID=1907219 RepID=A0A4P9Y7W0_9FUNG|nr:hypothetical protein BJ684DRAFT_14531 [Piptocephalis cylindrospora]|eukprot:RKP15188.1 hypothetical protein BJ684DRAFT_14531 [Piptocephalis cylindrospora]
MYKEGTRIGVEDINLSCTRGPEEEERSVALSSSPPPAIIPSTPPRFVSPTSCSPPAPSEGSLSCTINWSLHHLVDAALLPFTLDTIIPKSDEFLDEEKSAQNAPPNASSSSPQDPPVKDVPFRDEKAPSPTLAMIESFEDMEGRSYPLRKRNAISLHPYTLLQWTRPETMGRGRVDRRALRDLMNEPVQGDEDALSDDALYVEHERPMPVDPDDQSPEPGEKRPGNAEMGPRKRRHTGKGERWPHARDKKVLKARRGRKGGMSGVLDQLRKNEEEDGDDDDDENIPLSKLFPLIGDGSSPSPTTPQAILRTVRRILSDDDDDGKEEEDEEEIRGDQGKRVPWVINSDEEGVESAGSERQGPDLTRDVGLGVGRRNEDISLEIDRSIQHGQENDHGADEAMEAAPIIHIPRLDPFASSSTSLPKTPKEQRHTNYMTRTRKEEGEPRIFSSSHVSTSTHRQSRRQEPSEHGRKLPRRITAKSLMGKLPASFIRLNNLDKEKEITQAREEVEEVQSDDSADLPLARDQWVMDEDEPLVSTPLSPRSKSEMNWDGNHLLRPRPRKVKWTTEGSIDEAIEPAQPASTQFSTAFKTRKATKTYNQSSRRKRRTRKKDHYGVRRISQQAKPYLSGLDALAEASRSHRLKHSSQRVEEMKGWQNLNYSNAGNEESLRAHPRESRPLHFTPSSSSTQDPFPSFLRIPYRQIRQRIASSLPIRMNMERKVIMWDRRTNGVEGISRPVPCPAPSGRRRGGRKVMQIKSAAAMIHDRRAMMLGGGKKRQRMMNGIEPVPIEDNAGYVNDLERWMGYLHSPSSTSTFKASNDMVTSSFSEGYAGEPGTLSAAVAEGQMEGGEPDLETWTGLDAMEEMNPERGTWSTPKEGETSTLATVPKLHPHQIPEILYQFQQALDPINQPLLPQAFRAMSEPSISSITVPCSISVIDWTWSHLIRQLQKDGAISWMGVEGLVMEAWKSLAARILSIRLTPEERKVRKGVRGYLGAWLLEEGGGEEWVDPRILEQVWKFIFLCHLVSGLVSQPSPRESMHGWVEALLGWTLRCRRQVDVPEDPDMIYTALAISQAIYALWGSFPLLLAPVRRNPLPILIHLAVSLINRMNHREMVQGMASCVPGDVLIAAYRLMEHRRFRDYHGEDGRTGKDRCFSLFLHLLQGYLMGIHRSRSRIGQGHAMVWEEEDMSEETVQTLIIRLIPTVMFVFPDPILPYDSMYSTSAADPQPSLTPMTDTDGLYDLSSLSNVLAMFCTLLRHVPLSLVPAVSQRWSRTLRFREAGWAARTLALEGLASAERTLREDRRVGGGDPLVQYVLNAATCLVEEDRRRGGGRGRVEGMILLEKCLALLEEQRDRFGEVGGGWDAWESFHSALWSWFGTLNLLKEGDRGGVEEGIITRVMGFGESIVEKMLPHRAENEGGSHAPMLQEAESTLQTMGWEEEEEEGVSQEDWLKAVMAHAGALDQLDPSDSVQKAQQEEEEGLRKRKVILKDWMYPAIRGVWSKMMGIEEGGLIDPIRYGWEWSQRRDRRARVGKWLGRCLALLVHHQLKGWEAFLYPYGQDAWIREEWRMGMRAEWARVLLIEVISLDDRVIREHEEVCTLAWIDSAVVELGEADEEYREAREGHDRLGSLILKRNVLLNGASQTHWTLEWMIDQVGHQCIAWTSAGNVEGEEGWQGHRRLLQGYILAILRGMTRRLRELRETYFLGYQAVIASYHDASKGIARRILQVASGILLAPGGAGPGEGVGQEELLELLGPDYLGSSLATRDWMHRLGHLFTSIEKKGDEMGWDGMMRKLKTGTLQSQLVFLWGQLSHEGNREGMRGKAFLKSLLRSFGQGKRDAEKGWEIRVFIYQTLFMASLKDLSGKGGTGVCVRMCKGLFLLGLLPKMDIGLHADEGIREWMWLEWVCLLQLSLEAFPSIEAGDRWGLTRDQSGMWKGRRGNILILALDFVESLLRHGGKIWATSTKTPIWVNESMRYATRVGRVVSRLKTLMNGDDEEMDMGPEEPMKLVPNSHRVPMEIVQEYKDRLGREVQGAEIESEDSESADEEQGRARIEEQLSRVDRLVNRLTSREGDVDVFDRRSFKMAF